MALDPQFSRGARVERAAHVAFWRRWDRRPLSDAARAIVKAGLKFSLTRVKRYSRRPGGLGK